MNERDLWWKIVLVGGLMAMAFASITPVGEKIKLGIDLHGGYSLLYEIDDTGLNAEQKQDLSTRVITVLRERVDPNGVFNLVWRPVGHNRIEIQMPRPSKDLGEARSNLEAYRSEIQATHLRRSRIVSAVSLSGEDRVRRLRELAGQLEWRLPLLEKAAKDYDAFTAEEQAYKQRVAQIEADSLSDADVKLAVERPAAERAAAFDPLIRGIPDRRPALEQAAAAWDELQAARAATQPAATATPATQAAGTTTQPADDPNRTLGTKERAYAAAVRKVLDTNVDPDALDSGPTINTVVELEGEFEQAVRNVVARNIDTSRLQAVLDSKPGQDFRDTELQKIKDEFAGLSDTIDKMVKAQDMLKSKQRGEGRLEDPADLQRLLRGAGVLEFRILAELDSSEPDKYAGYVETLKARGPRRPPGEESYQWFEIEELERFLDIKDTDKRLILEQFEQKKSTRGAICETYGDKFYVLSHIGDSYSLVHKPGEADWSLKNATRDTDENGRPSIGFTLDERGGSRFHVLTRDNLKRQLCIFLDDRAVSHATIISPIRTRGQISGSFTVREVQEMVKKLEAGSLPRKLKDTPISVRSIGPTLGAANRDAGLRAAKYGAICVAIFMIIYYFYVGGIAVTAVAMNILCIGAMMATLGATLTLPGIAGIVLAVGMAVDANVLINERIREELERGTALRMAIKLGYERAFSAILDSNVTTVLTCVILYLLGSEEIKGFGLTLGIGVFINLFTSYVVTRMFFEVMSTLRVPREVTRYPIYAAVGIAAFGAAVYGLGHWVNDEITRPQSVLMHFGRAIMLCGPFIAGIVILMQVFRRIQQGREKRGKPGIPMLRLIGVPKIDWFGKRYVFAVISLIIVGGGATVFFTMDRRNLYDIEFLGGVSAQIDLKEPGSLSREEIEQRLAESGKTLQTFGKAVASSASMSGANGEWSLSTPGVPAARLVPLVKRTFANQLSQGSAVEYAPGADSMIIRTRADAKFDESSDRMVDLEGMKGMIPVLADALEDAGKAMAEAQVQSVGTFGTEEAADKSFDIVTRESNKEVVVDAIIEHLRDDIEIQSKLDSFQLLGDKNASDRPYFVIRSEKQPDLGLPDRAKPWPHLDLDDWVGGVAIVLEDISPPQNVQVLSKRLKAMRLQPGFEQFGWRESKCIPIEPVSPGSDLYKSVLVVVADENYPLDEGGEPSSAWIAELAEPEVHLLTEALQRQTSLRQITQFDQQVSSDAQRDALIALALSWIVIIIYVWFRFGNIRWGLAAVAALVHDVLIAAGAVALTYYIGGSVFGDFLDIKHFRIDLALVAAFLTVIGYSVNDTIVVFDRIRENRGRAADVTPEVMNRSVSETLSRTVLTLLTTLVAVLIMYIFGGPGIHGFNFVLLIGLSIGTYSSIGVASQLLVRRTARATA